MAGLTSMRRSPINTGNLRPGYWLSAPSPTFPEYVCRRSLFATVPFYPEIPTSKWKRWGVAAFTGMGLARLQSLHPGSLYRCDNQLEPIRGSSSTSDTIRKTASALARMVAAWPRCTMRTSLVSLGRTPSWPSSRCLRKMPTPSSTTTGTSSTRASPSQTVRNIRKQGPVVETIEVAEDLATAIFRISYEKEVDDIDLVLITPDGAELDIHERPDAVWLRGGSQGHGNVQCREPRRRITCCRMSRKALTKW